MAVQQTYYVDGTRCGSLADTAAELSAALGLEVPWYGNLGALDAILDERTRHGGQRLHIVWRSSDCARETLGYGETCRWLEERCLVWDHTHLPQFEAWIAQARGCAGATLFEMIVEVIAGHDGVDIELV